MVLVIEERIRLLLHYLLHLRIITELHSTFLTGSYKLGLIFRKLLRVKIFDLVDFLENLLHLLLVITIAVFFFFVTFKPTNVTLVINKSALLLTSLNRIAQLFVNHHTLVVNWHTPANLHLLALGPRVDRFRVYRHCLGPAGTLIRCSLHCRPSGDIELRKLAFVAKWRHHLHLTSFHHLAFYLIQSLIELCFHTIGVFFVIEVKPVRADVHVDQHIAHIFLEPVVTEASK